MQLKGSVPIDFRLQQEDNAWQRYVLIFILAGIHESLQDIDVVHLQDGGQIYQAAVNDDAQVRG
jgi:hypothetical protein